MNQNWLDFLQKNHATITGFSTVQFPASSETKETITALANLAVLKVTGSDAKQFLQGQLTCNVNELSNNNSFFAAFCNAKGRTISTLLILKQATSFLIILPHALLDKVTNKLKMYVLRSDVQLTNASEAFCLMGMNTDSTVLLPTLPESDFAVTEHDAHVIKLPAAQTRYLLIASYDKAEEVWSSLTQNNSLTPCSSNTWDYQDISAGMAWLSQESSEAFIPQMLNIDALGGISFNKGCYTGQEIVARTHYLGQSKRRLFLAECDLSAVVDSDTKLHEINSTVLSTYTNEQHRRLLLVMPVADSELKNLTLSNSNQDKISLITFQ